MPTGSMNACPNQRNREAEGEVRAYNLRIGEIRHTEQANGTKSFSTLRSAVREKYRQPP